MIMWTKYIISGVFFVLYMGVAIYFLYLLDKYAQKEHSFKLSIVALIMGLMLQGYGMSLLMRDYRKGQIDALKGKYKYRMEINYDQYGTPKDTIYVKL